MTTAILIFSKTRTDTSKPHMGRLTYEGGKRYTLDVARDRDFVEDVMKAGDATVLEADDGIAETLRALAPKPDAPPEVGAPFDETLPGLTLPLDPGPRVLDDVDPSLLAEDDDEPTQP